MKSNSSNSDKYSENKKAGLLFLLAFLFFTLSVIELLWFFWNDISSFLKKAEPSQETILIIIAGAVLLIIISICMFSFGKLWAQRSHEPDKKVGLFMRILAILIIIIFLPISIGIPIYSTLDDVPTQRGPYLSWTRDPQTSITISWEIIGEEKFVLEWGNGPSENDLSNIIEIEKPSAPVRKSDGYAHYSVTIIDLKPGTKYWYQIRPLMQKPVSFKTAPSSQEVGFKFIAYGDSREADKISGNQHIPLVEEMLKLNHAEDYAFVINSGDTAISHDDVKQWNLHFYAIRNLANQVPYFVASGNHEWNTAEGRNIEYGIQPAIDIQDFPNQTYPSEDIYSLDEVSYAFGYGALYVISVGYPDAGSNDSRFLNWFREQTAIGNSSYKFTAVAFHRPPFDDRVGDSNDDNEDIIRTLCPIIHEGGVDIVINGHNHILSRTNITWTRLGNNARNITYLTTGGGGASLRDYEGGSWNNKYGLGFKGDTEYYAKEYHFYIAEYNPLLESLEFTAYNEVGNVVDHFTLYAWEKN